MEVRSFEVDSPLGRWRMSEWRPPAPWRGLVSRWLGERLARGPGADPASTWIAGSAEFRAHAGLSPGELLRANRFEGSPNVAEPAA